MATAAQSLRHSTVPTAQGELRPSRRGEQSQSGRVSSWKGHVLSVKMGKLGIGTLRLLRRCAPRNDMLHTFHFKLQTAAEQPCQTNPIRRPGTRPGHRSREKGVLGGTCYVAVWIFDAKTQVHYGLRTWHVAVWTGAPENAVFGADQAGLALWLRGTRHGRCGFLTKKPRFTTPCVCGTWHVAVWVFGPKTQVVVCQDAKFPRTGGLFRG